MYFYVRFIYTWLLTLFNKNFDQLWNKVSYVFKVFGVYFLHTNLNLSFRVKLHYAFVICVAYRCFKQDLNNHVETIWSTFIL